MKMKRRTESERIKRLDFFRTGTGLAAGTMFMGLGTSGLFGAANAGRSGTAAEIESVTLNNGVTMPILGFGTLYLNGELGERCVAEAISMGYRLIDTAKVYQNEEAVGAGIKKSGIDRKELFVTSKIWVDDYGYESGKKAFQTALDKLDLDYLDLYLLHRPRGDIKGAWQALEELYEEGKIKVIGVSNFEDHHLEELMSYAKVTPAVNQIESHAFFHQNKANKSLKKLGIQMEAWSPLAQGRNGHFSNETLAVIGKKYDKNNAQVALRWHYQRGIVAIPRSSNIAHMMENLNSFDFELEESDIKKLEPLDLNITQFPEWE
jgi:2,5-diketo-D-gluconate reductase A